LFNGKKIYDIEGEWKVGDGIKVTIVIVYCTGSLREKKLIWEEICGFRMSLLNRAWWVVGKFNSIIRKEERKKKFVWF